MFVGVTLTAGSSFRCKALSPLHGLAQRWYDVCLKQTTLTRQHMNHPALSSFIWSVADLLRGDYKQSEYGRVILPFTVLRRLDCVLEATKPAILAEFDAKTKAGLNPEHFLLRKAGQSFYNTSPLDLVKL